MRFVLDASIACAWFLPNQATEYSRAIYEAAVSGEHLVIAPIIFETEVSNVLVKAVRTRRLTPTACEEAAGELALMTIELHDLAFSAHRLCQLSLSWGTSPFDTHYLALAQHLGVPLASRDNVLASAAVQNGVPLLTL